MNNIINEKKFIADRTGIPYANLSQSYLRSEVFLSNLSQYEFNLQNNSVAQPLVTERLLGLNDEFVITHIGMFIKSTGTTLGTSTTDPERHLAANLSNNIKWHNAVTGTSQSFRGLSTIWRSSLSMTIDRKEYLPEYSTQNFYRVGVLDNYNLIQEVPNGLYGFAPFEVVKIDGRQSQDIVLTLPTGTGATTDFTFTGGPGNPAADLYAVLMVKGYLVVNAKS